MPELADAEVEQVLDRFVRAGGGRLRHWRLRSVHRRGSSAVSLLVEGAVTDGADRDRDLLYVLHVTDHTVPDRAAVVEVGRTPVHVWQFPDDPYLPGLRPAVSRREARERWVRLGRAGSTADRPRIHTRSYRPTRRAVVELTPAGSTTPELYLKVMGGRDDGVVRDRTTALVATHEHLGRFLPVPSVLEHDPAEGTVALAPLAGETLRRLLRRGAPLPPAADVAALVERIAATPTPPGDADPGRYADITRHVRLLARVVPDAAEDLAAVAAAVTRLGGPVGTLHGDLHDGQVTVADDAVVGLLDVDGAGTGLLAHDAGRLVANVEVAALTAPAQAERARAYATSMASCLADVVPARDLALAAAAAWVGLATGPYRVRGDGWRDATRARIAQARRWVHRSRVPLA